MGVEESGDERVSATACADEEDEVADVVEIARAFFFVFSAAAAGRSVSLLFPRDKNSADDNNEKEKNGVSRFEPLQWFPDPHSSSVTSRRAEPRSRRRKRPTKQRSWALLSNLEVHF